jgi:alanine-synthesizing transaminase
MSRIIPAKRTEKVTYAIRDVVVKAKKLEAQGKKVLYLNIGDPPVYDFETPLELRKVIVDKIMSSNAGAKINVATYGDSLGLQEARESVAHYAREKKSVKDVTYEDVLMSTGASEAITIAIAALVNPGDNIMTPCPGYPLYISQTAIYHGEINPYFMNEENEWQIDFDELEKRVNDRTKAIVVINPNNPTGATYSRETLANIIEFARRHSLVIFSDEIYDKLLFDGREHISVASLSEDVPVITFGGMSKNYIMPGWRVGWAIFHDPQKVMVDYKKAVEQLMRARLCSPHPQQYTVKPALEGNDEHLNEVLPKIQRRRDITYNMLNQVPGISCIKPKGAFYAFPKVQLPEGIDDEQYVIELLEETGVLVVYGKGFGEVPGTGHFRTVFLPDDITLKKSYELIAGFTEKFYKKYNFTPGEKTEGK